jgi:hypothetical protein
MRYIIFNVNIKKGDNKMIKTELLKKLEEIRGGEYFDDGISQNSLSDFIDIPPEIQSDDDIMGKLWTAVNNRITYALSAELENLDPDEVNIELGETGTGIIWERYCNLEINVDFNDIQGLLYDYVSK